MTDSAETVARESKLREELASKIKAIRLQIISDGGDPDVDCFSNHSARSKDKDTCGVCGVAKECSKATRSLEDTKSKLSLVRFSFAEEITKKREEIAEDLMVKRIVRKLSEKHKEIKKIMSKEETKEKKSKKSGGEKKTKDGGSGDTLFGSTIPSTFKSLYKAVKSLGEMEKKVSVTNIKADKGIKFCFPKSGATDEKVEIYLNRSNAYKGIEKMEPKHVGVKLHSKGDIILTVKSSSKSQDEAVELLKRWDKDRSKHIESGAGKRVSSEKKSKKAGKSAEKSSGKEKSGKSKKGGEEKGEKKKSGKLFDANDEKKSKKTGKDAPEIKAKKPKSKD